MKQPATLAALITFISHHYRFELIRTQNPTTVTNLAATTPFTFVETYFLSSGCATYPTILYEYFTVYVRGSEFPGPSESIPLGVNSQSTIYVTHTFPNLTLSELTPGEELTIVMAR